MCDMEKTVQIPEGVTAEKKGTMFVVTGPKGTLEKEFNSRLVTWSVKTDTFTITSTNERRKSLAMTGTYAAHARNLVTGVTKGYQATLKAVYSHFPMKIKIDGQVFKVDNFMGERSSRVTTIPEGVKIEVKKDDVLISGINKEDVGQTAGKIERITRVTRFDRRVFQDGIHLTQKARPQEQV